MQKSPSTKRISTDMWTVLIFSWQKLHEINSRYFTLTLYFPIYCIYRHINLLHLVFIHQLLSDKPVIEESAKTLLFSHGVYFHKRWLDVYGKSFIEMA